LSCSVLLRAVLSVCDTPWLWRWLLVLTAVSGSCGVRVIGGVTGVCGTVRVAAKTISVLLGRAVELVVFPSERARLDRAEPDVVLCVGVTAALRLATGTIGGAVRGAFFGFAALRLITTAALRGIAALHPTGASGARRFRPVIVVDMGGGGFAVDDWVGRELRVGDDLIVRVIVTIPCCVIAVLARGGLPGFRDVLRVLARLRRVVALPAVGSRPCAGIYARVLRPGRFRPGDPVRAV
jgi:uncharacterized protein YcbX